MIRDVSYVASMIAMSAGCFMAWPPLALIVPSGIVLAVLISTERRKPPHVP